MTDPISDMIIRMKNASASHKEAVTFPYSKLREHICALLEKEGFVGAVAKKGKKITKSIEVSLNYNGRAPRIQGVKRISKPSRRIYKRSSEIRPVRRGYGMLVLSTPKGILSDSEARKSKVGGEALFEIW
ncbi:MAG: 30S ribosomal protein S8 [Candidatus Zambryskibacteria bacterium RIFCSPHIGHO2_01_FULL_43_27]|uniref:Small ribosomal subunit protein uS8 n=1 Tax=Candidatus Zambryskibacteria bacterium RIFCSPLOWO2_01_FULL_43_17 TaxID=1802760 RepID=A0A1G2U5N0_9BACT|nr:MAG: 30S ribosomal protein S8 [Candidatus Zambryskibacteria bacterium RIFCSPHIGHO2_01_FULL_43_27]OHB00028.1 MAG: 30S ribosomal protein S8 [Candidatus Zambryskibacteria bacterium RIFCSPHIGHO2_12_FULL_43_12b]OHB04260.1 MAG: 30S ribosomal protein S8 [Candidatus Zambryskibacteria bacterium RIFCSPLOWO2_01_FULL_43_17]